MPERRESEALTAPPAGVLGFPGGDIPGPPGAPAGGRTPENASPAWAAGYDVAHLKAITAIFKAHDEGMVHGPFGRYSELDAVADLKRGALRVDARRRWALAARVLDRRAPIRDFTGATRLTLEPGTWLVARMAWVSDEGADRVEAMLRVDRAAAMLPARGPLAVWAWQEHAEERSLVESLDLEMAAVKISAASEMRGLYVMGTGPLPEPYSRQQAVGLATLPLSLDAGALASLETAARRGPIDYADHYSGYQKGQSWSALALRGFYDDPRRIEKPGEMNKKWKAAHADDLKRGVRDTALRAALPDCEALLAAIPCRGFERIRLMRLAPGGGELTRHADITDADAGAEPGCVVRVHIPLISNPECVFTSWDLDGRPHWLHMAPGRAYYLDVRKPHTAVNNGSEPRIHLVADAIADCRLCNLLREAWEAPLGMGVMA